MLSQGSQRDNVYRKDSNHLEQSETSQNKEILKKTKEYSNQNLITE